MSKVYNKPKSRFDALKRIRFGALKSNRFGVGLAIAGLVLPVFAMAVELAKNLNQHLGALIVFLVIIAIWFVTMWLAFKQKPSNASTAQPTSTISEAERRPARGTDATKKRK